MATTDYRLVIIVKMDKYMIGSQNYFLWRNDPLIIDM